LAVQWLNEALCFVSIPIAIGSGGRQFSASIRRGGRQLLVAAFQDQKQVFYAIN